MAFQINVNERSAGAVYEVRLRDVDKETIPMALLQSITLHLVEPRSGTVIRSYQDALNANNCTYALVDGEWVFSWTIQESDTTIHAATGEGQWETHPAILTFRWDGGVDHRRVDLNVLNLLGLPQPD